MVRSMYLGVKQTCSRLWCPRRVCPNDILTYLATNITVTYCTVHPVTPCLRYCASELWTRYGTYFPECPDVSRCLYWLALLCSPGHEVCSRRRRQVGLRNSCCDDGNGFARCVRSRTYILLCPWFACSVVGLAKVLKTALVGWEKEHGGFNVGGGRQAGIGAGVKEPFQPCDMDRPSSTTSSSTHPPTPLHMWIC